MKFWYPRGLFRKRIGTISWLFDEYVELCDCETNDYVIVKLEEIELI